MSGEDMAKERDWNSSLISTMVVSLNHFKPLLQILQPRLKWKWGWLWPVVCAMQGERQEESVV